MTGTIFPDLGSGFCYISSLNVVQQIIPQDW